MPLLVCFKMTSADILWLVKFLHNGVVYVGLSFSWENLQLLQRLLFDCVCLFLPVSVYLCLEYFIIFIIINIIIDYYIIYLLVFFSYSSGKAKLTLKFNAVKLVAELDTNRDMIIQTYEGSPLDYGKDLNSFILYVKSENVCIFFSFK
jgi:hypothetical protein